MIGVEDFRREARRWLAGTTIPVTPLDLEARFETLRAWQRQLAEAGWVGIHWPEEVGGRGLTPDHHFAFFEELTAARAPAPIGLIGLEVVGPSILEHGTEKQRMELLPPLLTGDDIWCQGFSEPDAGSDLASLRTRARHDGDGFVIDGQKVWTSWAHEATWCAVLARTDTDAPKHRGISYFLVPMDAPGVSVRPLVQLTGDAEFGEIFFDAVRVDESHLLGEVNDGWPIAMNTLGHERGAYTIRRRAESEVAFRDLLAELSPIADQLPDRVAERIGDSYLGLRALAAQTQRTKERLRTGEAPSATDSVDKLLLTEVEQQVAATGFDCLGPARMGGGEPYGLDADRRRHEYFFSRAGAIYGGTTQIQRNIVAERLLGLPKD